MLKRIGVLLFTALPLFGAGRRVTAPTFGTSAYDISGRPVVASSSDRFLTLWTTDIPTAGPHVFGSLADAKAKTITPLSFVVCPNARVLYVAGSQNGFVALLADQRGAYRVATISADGELLQLSEGHGSLADTVDSRVAFDGKYFLVIARLADRFGYPSATAVERFVDLNGSVDEHALPDGTYAADVIHVNGAFVLFSSNAQGVFYQRFAASGFPLSPSTQLMQSRCDAVAASSNGRTYAIACTNGRPPDPGVSVSIFATDGAPLGTTLLHFFTYETRVSWANDSYLVILKSGSSYAWRVDERGNVMAEDRKVGGINSAGIGNVILTAGTPEGTADTVASVPVTIDLNGMRIGEPDTLSYTWRRQSVDAIATDGLDFISTWTDVSAMNHPRISGMSLSSGATPLDPGQTDLGTTYDRSSIAFGKTVYLIVSQENGAVVARRVLPRGGILDAVPIVIGNGHIANSAVAWNGSRFAVAWGQYDRRLTFIDEAGVVSAATILPNDLPNRQMLFSTTGSIAWDGRYFLLGSFYYEAFACTCPAMQRGINVSRLRADGSFVDAVQVETYASRFHIASGVRESLMVSDFGGSVFAQVIHADDTLTVDPAFTLSSWYGRAMSNVAWNGSSYTVALQSGFAANWWLSTLTVNSPRDVIQQTVVATSPGEAETPPAIAFNEAGTMLIATSEVEPAIGAARVRAYSEEDLHSSLPRPAAPRITSAVKTLRAEGGTLATVTWEIDASNVTGFAIEWVDGTYATPVAIVDAAARSATIGNADRVRVRAFGPGGISEPSATMVALLPRHRAVVH
jgi:hypothetical protein